VISLPPWLEISPYWRSLHDWMLPLGLLSASPIVVAPQLSKTTFETASLLEWISPLVLLSASLVVAALQLPEAASEASFGATC